MRHDPDPPHHAGHDPLRWVGRVLAGSGLLLVTSFAPGGGAPAVVAAAPPAPLSTSAGHAAVTTPSPVAVGLEMPAIGVAEDLVRLGREADGTMEVPEDFGAPGWYEPGAGPGEDGPLVIAGHVDSRTGPAVFWDLHRLEPGDLVHVTDGDGMVHTYEVERVEQYAKESLPTFEVFGATDGPALRLITCGGAFDREARSYADNLVVYASLAR